MIFGNLDNALSGDQTIMQTVNENVPATKVVKVSELRTADHILDDAMFMGVQNGRGFKTTYGAVKNQIAGEIGEQTQFKVNELKSGVDTKITELSNNVASTMQQIEDLNNDLQSKNQLLVDKLAQLSSAFEYQSSNSASHLSALDKNMELLNSEMQTTSINMSNLSTDMIKAASTILNADERSQLLNDIEKLKSQNNILQTQIDILKEALSEKFPDLLSSQQTNN